MTFVMTLMAAPAQLGWQIPPGQHILKLSASPDDPSCKKAGLGYTLESGHPGATDAAHEALGPRFRGGDGEEKIGLICLVRTN